MEGLRPPTEDDEKTRRSLEADWRRWVPEMFPGYISDDDGRVLPFADHQQKMWDHVWTIEPGERPPPFVGIWGRGLGKSTTAEMACVALGARKKKRYVLYVSGTQEQADDHVANIGDMLASPSIERYYPELAQRDINKFGSSKGWRRNRLRTAASFTVDAIGLDVARTRGAKLEDARPDLIILDDVDDGEDSEDLTNKKVRALTRKLLPAGSADLAVIAIQNLVHEASIFSQLADGTAKFLNDRIVSGPIPAIHDLDYDEEVFRKTGRLLIRSGRPAWAGLSLDRAQRIALDEGGEAFLVERQHLTYLLGGLIYKKEYWDGDDRRYHYGLPMYDLRSGWADEVWGRYLFADTNYKDKDSTSDTAFTGFELMSSLRVRLCYLWSGKLEFPYLLKNLEEVAIELNYDGGLSGIVIEDKASGISAVQTLYMAADDWMAEIIDSFEPGNRSKDERDKQAAQYAQAGGVLLPYPDVRFPELQDFIDEELNKARPQKRDRRDAFTMGILYLENYLAEWHRAEIRRLSGMQKLDGIPREELR